MNTLKKTSAGIAVAAVILGGSYGLYTSFSKEEPKDTPIVFGAENSQSSDTIDWSKYELDVPTLDVPTLDVPELQITLNDDNERTVVTMKPNNRNVFVIDNTEIETMSLANIPLIIENKDIVLPKESASSIKIMSLDKVLYQMPSEDLADWELFEKTAKAVFTDKRMIDEIDPLAFKNKNMNAWLKIYSEYQDKEPVKFIAISAPFRMITEVCIPASNSEVEMLSANLEFYKSKGYDSVLVTFTGDDEPNSVLNTVKYIIKNHSMKVWLAYSGKESLKTNVLCDPERLKESLALTAPYLSGYINSWRRTSSHLWQQDLAFMNYVNYILRSSNPSLPIVGELYFGNTYQYDQADEVGYSFNDFTNSSAVMFVNFGFYNVNVDHIMKNILTKKLGDAKKIACVVGSNAYYLSKYPNGLTFQENLQIKKMIEDRFIEAGCIGVVTLSDDGKSLDSNNLSKTHYSLLGRQDK